MKNVFSPVGVVTMKTHGFFLGLCPMLESLKKKSIIIVHTIASPIILFGVQLIKSRLSDSVTDMWKAKSEFIENSDKLWNIRLIWNIPRDQNKCKYLHSALKVNVFLHEILLLLLLLFCFIWPITGKWFTKCWTSINAKIFAI